MPSSRKTTTYRKAVVWDYNTVFGASDEFRCYRLSDQHVQALMSALTAMQWRTRWTDAPEDMREIFAFVGGLAYSLLTPTNCDPVPVPSGDDNGGDPVAAFDQFLDLLQELDVKYRIDGQLYEPVIDLVPCGCGGSGDDEVNYDGQSQELNIPGSSSGGQYGDFVTLCDALTVLPDYLNQAWRDYLDEINKFAQGGGVADDAANEILAAMISGLLNAIDELFDMLDSQSFQNKTREICMKYFADPWKRPTRKELTGFAVQFPSSFEGAPAFNMVTAWAQTANIDLLDNTVRAAKGQGDINECVPAFAEVGRVPFTNSTPVEVTPEPPVTQLTTVLTNDSGIAGLTLKALLISWELGYQASGSIVPAYLDGLAGNTVYACGVQYAVSDYQFNLSFAKLNVSQWTDMIFQAMSAEPTSGIISGSNGLTLATQDEIANIIFALSGETPLFGHSLTNGGLVSGDKLGARVNSVASGAGTLETRMLFAVIAPTP